MGDSSSCGVGRVYVNDKDDWDIPDKTFSWSRGKPQYPYFSLNKDSGVIRMKHGTPEGRFVLRFKVYDRKHTQTDVPANVTVVVKQISHEAVVNSGSFRIVGIDAEELIRVWDWRKERVAKSKMQMFKEKLAAVVPDRPSLDNIDVFSVMLACSLIVEVVYSAFESFEDNAA